MTSEVSPEWNKIRSWAMEVLQKEAELQEIVQLVGSDALPEAEQVTIEVARMIREIFLQQNAYDAVDTFCDMTKQYDMMKAIRKFSDLAYAAQAAGVLPHADHTRSSPRANCPRSSSSRTTSRTSRRSDEADGQ